MELPLTKTEVSLLVCLLVGGVLGTLIDVVGLDKGRLPDLGVCYAEVERMDSEMSDTIINTIPVNINTAAEEELVTLNGIGPVLAGRIIEDRAKNGPYKTVEELQRVSGIGKTTIVKLKGQATTGR